MEHQTNPHFYQKFVVYAVHTADELERLNCDNRTVMIFDSGTWDLTFFPAVNFILNSRNGPKLINAIKNLMNRPQCKANVKLLFLTTVPHPSCRGGDCNLMMNYWRHNTAIKAINSYIIQNIMQLKLGKSVVILDTIPIILPRLLRWDDEVIQANHFLFSGHETTPPGIVVAMEALHEICAEEISDSHQDVWLTEAEELFAIFSKANNHLSYYRWSYHTGCYREFPDNYTFTSYGYNESNFRVWDDAHDLLTQYTPCPNRIYPSRKNGTMFKILRDRTVYMLDCGLLRPIASAQVVEDLHRDFSETVIISAEDLHSFPSGPMIDAANDVNYLKYPLQ